MLVASSSAAAECLQTVTLTDMVRCLVGDHDRDAVSVFGLMELSQARRPSIPCTFKSVSTTARSSWPILQVPIGCSAACACLRT